MKRIRYVSEVSAPMTSAAISELGRRSTERNEVHEITGMLIASGDLFFQVIEGPDGAVDRLFANILADERHHNVLVLRIEQGDLRRICPDWAMRELDVSAETSERLEPIRAILRGVVAQALVAGDLAAALEKQMMRLLVEAEQAVLVGDPEEGGQQDSE